MGFSLHIENENPTTIVWGECHFKVQLIWEGHKNVRNLPYYFEIYRVNVKTIMKVRKFVAFSEKLKFKQKIKLHPTSWQ